LQEKLKKVLALIVDGIQVSLNYEPGKAEDLVSYIHDCMISDSLCVMKESNRVVGIFRGKNISGMFFTEINETLRTLQIEHLHLSNLQLKDILKVDDWRREKFD